MRLNFERIEMHNFMSFDDEVFDFTEYNGLTLVKGKNNDIPGSRNGVGKSVTFEALLFVLFGQLQDKIKNENVINRYSTDRDMRIVLMFSVDDRHYKAIRGISKGRSSYFELQEMIGDKTADLTKSSIAETQEYLETDVIHCDISIFLRTILLTADQTYNFYKLKKADKKDFVEKLFDISVFGDMYSLIHKDILTLDKEILARQNQLLVLNKNLTDYESRISVYDSNRQVKIAKFVDDIKKAEDEYSALKSVEVADNSAEVEKYTAALAKLDDAISKNEKAVRRLESERTTAKISIGTAEAQKNASQKIIDKHSDLMARLCDDCRPVFSDYYNITALSKSVGENTATITTLEAKAAELSAKIAELQTKTTTYKSKRTKAVAKIAELTADATKANKALLLAESRLTTLKRDLDQTKAETNPYVEMLAESKQTIEKETSLLSKIEAKYNYIKFAESIVSQETLRKLIIKDLIVLLNNRVKTYLTKLGAKYYVKFDEDMDYEFITDGGTCEFGNFSAGEKMRTMIATSFAFRDFMSIRNGLNSNVLILDEYFDSAIDSLCVGSILEILKDYNKSMKQNIFVISHRTEVSDDEFDNIMQVEKTRNISRISKLK